MTQSNHSENFEIKMELNFNPDSTTYDVLKEWCKLVEENKIKKREEVLKNLLDKK